MPGMSGAQIVDLVLGIVNPIPSILGGVGGVVGSVGGLVTSVTGPNGIQGIIGAGLPGLPSGNMLMIGTFAIIAVVLLIIFK